MLTTDQLNRLSNHGFTSQGAAIVNAIWFTTCSGHQIGIALICNPVGKWKAYIGSVFDCLSEDAGTVQICESGSKIPFELAKAAFRKKTL
jgi:hypothetical protein